MDFNADSSVQNDLSINPRVTIKKLRPATRLRRQPENAGCDQIPSSVRCTIWGPLVSAVGAVRCALMRLELSPCNYETNQFLCARVHPGSDTRSAALLAATVSLSEPLPYPTQTVAAQSDQVGRPRQTCAADGKLNCDLSRLEALFILSGASTVWRNLGASM